MRDLRDCYGFVRENYMNKMKRILLEFDGPLLNYMLIVFSHNEQAYTFRIADLFLFARILCSCQGGGMRLLGRQQ